MRPSAFLLCPWLCLLVPTAVFAWSQECITKPIGFGYKTTGGQGGRTVTPKSPQELRKYLASSEPLNINLDRTYDFTLSEGIVNETGCFFIQCGTGFQQSLIKSNTCNGREPTTVQYSKAGETGINVASNKTIFSENGKGVIKGKGLNITNEKNIILRDFTISDINPKVIWGGDAIGLTNVTDIWIHRLTIERIGRQFLVAHKGVNRGITVSSCLFNGTTTNSAYCNGNHYWVFLFWGNPDEITLINNRVINTSGRTPHAGGWNGSENYVHMLANEFDTNVNAGIEAKLGSNILSEGNRYVNFANPINLSAKGGHLAMVNTRCQATICEKYLGRVCLPNKYRNSTITNRFEASVLQQFKKLDQYAISSAQEAAACLVMGGVDSALGSNDYLRFLSDIFQTIIGSFSPLLSNNGTTSGLSSA